MNNGEVRCDDGWRGVNGCDGGWRDWVVVMVVEGVGSCDVVEGVGSCDVVEGVGSCDVVEGWVVVMWWRGW